MWQAVRQAMERGAFHLPLQHGPLCASLPLGPAAREEVREAPRELCFQAGGAQA